MKKLIVIGGPTASGKTALAIEWALKYNTEILSADSRQCYKELNIGVAKPNLEELNLVPHHFINSHHIHENVSAGDYERYALQVLHKLFETKDIVICVGGTGLYLQALCEGIDEMPAVDLQIKSNIEQTFKEKGMLWLQEETQKVDPKFYAEGEQNNPSRLLRALIFYLSHATSIATFRQHKPKTRPFVIEKYFLDIERNALYERINQRVDNMIEQGLVNEVKRLLPFASTKNLQTVGYQELFEFFNEKMSLNESIEKIKQHTRNYAKRQITWFKNNGSYEALKIS